MGFVTRFGQAKRVIDFSGTLADAATAYLCTLSNSVPDSTYQSHQTTVTKFVRWCRDKAIDREELQEAHVVEFIEFLVFEEDLSIDTAAGHTSSLSNFLSFLYQQDPEIVKIRIASRLQQSPVSDLEAVGKQTANIIDADRVSTEASLQAVEALLAYLRNRRFGTRTHAYVELLRDTRSRPEQVRRLNLSDLSLDEKTVAIGIADTHVVRTAGLVTERSVELSAPTIDALETYINYERKEGTEGTCRPVFTTVHGRASPSTLRRSIKRASTTVAGDSAFQSEPTDDLNEGAESSEQLPPVVPTDIWRHAITTIPDHQ